MSIDLSKIVIKSTNKDVHNMGLFVAAVAKKVEEKVLSNSSDTQFFAGAFASLMADWAAVLKQPWYKLIGDPFKGMREETRLFAKQWELDPDLIKAIG